MMIGKKIPLAIKPCLKSECDMWREGGVHPYPQNREIIAI